MKIDGVDFAEGFVEGFKSPKSFISEMETEGYGHIFANVPDRQGKLNDVYNLHVKATPPEEGATDNP